MARIVTYMIIFAGMLALMAMAGLPTTTSQILSALQYGNFSHFLTSTLAAAAVAIFAAAAIAGVIIGTLTRQSTESYLVAGIAGTLLTLFIADMISIVNYFNGVCPVGSGCAFVSKLVFLIMFAMAAGFIISIIQWWRGNDI